MQRYVKHRSGHGHFPWQMEEQEGIYWSAPRRLQQWRYAKAAGHVEGLSMICNMVMVKAVQVADDPAWSSVAVCHGV